MKIKHVSPSKDILDFLSGCVGCIEATRCEELYIWEHAQKAGHKIESFGSGYLPIIAMISKRPVTLSLLKWTINGHTFLIYHSPSTIVDHDVIRHWLDKYMPVTAFVDNDPRKRLNNTDATNWSNVIPREKASL